MLKRYGTSPGGSSRFALTRPSEALGKFLWFDPAGLRHPELLAPKPWKRRRQKGSIKADRLEPGR